MASIATFDITRLGHLAMIPPIRIIPVTSQWGTYVYIYIYSICVKVRELHCNRVPSTTHPVFGHHHGSAPSVRWQQKWQLDPWVNPWPISKRWLTMISHYKWRFVPLYHHVKTISNHIWLVVLTIFINMSSSMGWIIPYSYRKWKIKLMFETTNQ